MTPDYDGYNWTVNAVKMWEDENKSRLRINGFRCNVEIIMKNSGGDARKAADIAEWLIEQNVVAIVGPEYSSLAIPAGEVANYSETPIIATTATHPNVTLDRPYVFIMGSGNKAQAKVLAELGTDLYDAKTASVLYQDDLAYSADFASNFKEYWEGRHGLNSIVSYVSFNTTNINASDYKKQSFDISESNANVLFVPILATQIPEVMKAVRDAGYENPILGGDDWGVVSALQKCGEACKDAFFTPLFVPDIPDAESFVRKYTEKYGEQPNGRAALAYDAMNLVEVALKNYGEWQCNIFKNRDGLRDALENVKNFGGVSGKLTFDEEHTKKCVHIARVNATFYPTYLFTYCPN
jgi:branched-chain amino acid transport system substrate-binding protein